MRQPSPVVFINSLIGSLDYPALHTLLHLLAGEHPREGWDVPEWATEQAASSTVMPGTDHLMILEQPEQFALAIRQILDGH